MSGAAEVTMIVIAKEPVAGRCKTRLCPPLTPAQAAAVAEAALVDTLAAVATAPAARRLLVLDGCAGAWLPPGFDVVAQPDGGLDRRLGAALEAARGPALLVGMDTPQLTPALLRAGARALTSESVDAVLGPALDGGYWALGMRRPRADAVAGVPMSVEHTGEAQRQRLRALGLRWRELAPLRDVDTIEDARAVATCAPRSRFAAALDGMAVANGSAPRRSRIVRTPTPAWSRRR